MKKIVLCALLLMYFHAAFGETREEQSHFNPDGKIGGAILTCLAGFHTGNSSSTTNNDSPDNQKQEAMVEGFFTSVSIKVPISKVSTLLVNLNYDQISFTPETVPATHPKAKESILSVAGGVRLFIFGD